MPLASGIAGSSKKLRELSLHILDIAENGITADADLIEILVEEDHTMDQLTIKITDNGQGMPAEKIENINDPFVTSRTTRRVGLGLSLLAAAAERCEGRLTVKTEPGAGTQVGATFRHSHIDRAPVGDMAATITTLIMGNPQIDFVYTHIINGEEFTMDTRELKAEMGNHSLTNPVVIHHLTASIRNSLGQLTVKNGQ
jgi:hypothetical protein